MRNEFKVSSELSPDLSSYLAEDSWQAEDQIAESTLDAQKTDKYLSRREPSMRHPLCNVQVNAQRVVDEVGRF